MRADINLCPLPRVQSLLCDPNPNSPANSEAAKLYGENRREYNKRVKEIVELSWMDSPVGTLGTRWTSGVGGVGFWGVETKSRVWYVSE